MKKSRHAELIRLANEKLLTSNLLGEDGSIAETYNGKIAALSVSIALMDLLPTLAVYYNDSDTGICKRNILNVVATMITNPQSTQAFSDSTELFSYAISVQRDPTVLKSLKREIIDCSIALKQVVRTYNLV